MPRRTRKKPTRSVPTRKTIEVPGVVPHPRYGSVIVDVQSGLSAEEIRQPAWLIRDAKIFPETAIKADMTRQNFSVTGRPFYVDMLRQCRTCGRGFVFYAREQLHWYEVLKFNIEADCVDCPECRRSSQQLRRRFQRYSANVSREQLDNRALATLVGDAVDLWRAGVLRDEQRLRRLRNLARRQIPKSTATASIEELITELASAEDQHK